MKKVRKRLSGWIVGASVASQTACQGVGGRLVGAAYGKLPRPSGASLRQPSGSAGLRRRGFATHRLCNAVYIGALRPSGKPFAADFFASFFPAHQAVIRHMEM